MKKTFTIIDTDCSEFAADIEKDVSKLEYVSAANVKDSLLTVEFTKTDTNKLSEQITDIVRHYYANAVIQESICDRECLCTDNNSLTQKALSEKSIHKQNYRKNISEHTPLTNTFFSNNEFAERVFYLKGLDCPHCSAEIENDVLKMDGVSAAAINLVKQMLTVELSSDCDEDLFENIQKIVHKYEPDVIVCNKNECNTLNAADDNIAEEIQPSDNEKAKKQKISNSDENLIPRLIIGAVIFTVGFAMPHMGLFNDALVTAILIVSYIVLGYDVILRAVRNISHGSIFDENFLMTVSTVGAFIIGEYPEAAAVMLFYQIGEYFQRLAVKRSRKSISELMDIRPDRANVKRNNIIITVSPEDVSIGESIVIKPGEKIPLDGIVTDGEAMLNTAALTGESIPRKAAKGDCVLSGCINENGMLTVRVTKTFGESTASKILELVENAAGRKAPSENFITSFSRYYTPIVVIMAVLIGVIPPLILGGDWSNWIHRCFVFLVISCPCALVISIPLTFFGGIGAASRKGILVKGSSYLEALTAVDTIVFDKTGTLTKGVFDVTDIIPSGSFSKEKLLEIGANAEAMSNHPIARSIVRAYGKSINKSDIDEYEEISGQGVKAVIKGKTILAGNEMMMKTQNIAIKTADKMGTVVYFAVNNTFAGSIIISDEIKSDTKDAVLELKKLGISKTVMLTGDSESTAKAIADEIGIAEYYSELLPDQKVEKLERLDNEKQANKKLAFVGDGINDAPVLARADVGIAMGALGSDAAIEAADVVLMTDEPSKLTEAIKTARYTKKIVMQNIIFVIAVKILFLVLGAFGIAGMWEAVFGDVGVMIIAVINSMRLLNYK